MVLMKTKQFTVNPTLIYHENHDDEYQGVKLTS